MDRLRARWAPRHSIRDEYKRLLDARQQLKEAGESIILLTHSNITIMKVS